MRYLSYCILLFSGVLFIPADLQAGLPSRSHDFAQIADGDGFRTLILIMNQNAESVTVTLKFFDDDGNPLSLTFNGMTGSEISVDIVADGSTILSTPGVAAVAQTGWCNLTATEAVGAQVLFESISGAQIISQAAVESIGTVTYVDIFVNEGDTTNTGFALANLDESGEITIRITFTENDGTEIGTADLTLPRRGHIATFVFRQIADAFGKQGRLRIQTSGPVAVVALQLTGPVLGTLAPVIIIV